MNYQENHQKTIESNRRDKLWLLQFFDGTTTTTVVSNSLLVINNDKPFNTSPKSYACWSHIAYSMVCFCIEFNSVGARFGGAKFGVITVFALYVYARRARRLRLLYRDMVFTLFSNEYCLITNFFFNFFELSCDDDNCC